MSPCQGCHSGCCRAFAIPVTGADLLRIELDRGYKFADIACRWEDSEGQIACGVMPHFHFADEPQTPFAICLKHEASQIFRRTTKCCFLQESAPTALSPLGESRCGIYESRPLGCRVFPTRLNTERMQAEVFEIPAHGRANDPHPIYSLCGRPWEISDLDPVQAVQDLVLVRFELDFFAKVAAVWNRAVAEFEVFPEFLREVYRNRVVYETRDGCRADLPASIKGDFSSRRRAA